MLNPKVQNPAGPIDPQIIVLSAKSGGKIAGVLINYSNHVDVLGGSEISPDYPGFIARLIRRRLGRSIVPLFLNGALGDVNHINVMREGDYRGMRAAIGIAKALYSGVLDALRRAHEIQCTPMGGMIERVKLPIRKPSPKEIAIARKILSDERANVVDRVYAEEWIKLLLFPSYIETEIQVLRLGELVIVGLPGEPFCELGRRLKGRSPFPYTMVVGLANDYVGYIPTERAFREGGYEVRLARHSKLCPKAVRVLMAKAESMIRRIYES